MADNFSNLFSQLAPLLQSGQGQQLMGNLMSMMRDSGNRTAPSPTYEPSHDAKDEAFVPPFGGGGQPSEGNAPLSDFPQQDNAFGGASLPFSKNPNPMDNAMEHLLHVKNVYDQVMNEPDSRVNLLMALKPYMGENRLGKIDRVVWMMKLTKFSKQILPFKRG